MEIYFSLINIVKSNYGSTMNDENLESELKCALKIRHTQDFEDMAQNK